MTKAAIAAVALASAVLAAAPALAHHSAVQFDFTKSVPMKGTVKKFDAINPHMRMILAVNDAKGARDIEFEGHSTNNMYRGGYRKGMVKVGDAITVNIAPLKTGADGGFVVSATTADGKFFGLPSRQLAANPDAARATAEGR
jgi:hypothetical protein